MRRTFKLYRKDEIRPIDPEQELIDLLSNELASEIDREIMSSLLSFDLLSMPSIRTAPLPMPSGQLFYLDFVYGSATPVGYFSISYRESFKLKRKKR